MSVATKPQPQTEKDDRIRTAVCLSPEAHRFLWMDRISGQQTISDLVDAIVRKHYARKSKPSPERMVVS